MRRLFVIVGAGASHGCAPPEVPRNVGWKPPLVKDLFSHRTDRQYHSIIQKYPLAGIAASELIGDDNSVAIEEVLRTRYRDSADEFDKRVFNSIGPFLQELLWSVSGEYTKHPVHYQALVAKLVRLPEVVFITLNYDLLLDRVLREADPTANAMGWYIQPDRRWCLIKLHGSVNWVRNVKNDGHDVFHRPPLYLDLMGDIQFRDLDSELWKMRGLSSAGGGYTYGERMFPVLSVPLGSADAVSCPDTHVAYLRAKLASCEELDLCLIGYSAHDAEVMKLVSDSGKLIRSLTVVDQDGAAAQRIIDRMREEHGLSAQDNDPFEGSFGPWVTKRLETKLQEWQA